MVAPLRLARAAVVPFAVAAAYRIVQEALMNVDKHSQATRCLVRLGVAEAGAQPGLEVEVRARIPLTQSQEIGVAR